MLPTSLALGICTITCHSALIIGIHLSSLIFYGHCETHSCVRPLKCSKITWGTQNPITRLRVGTKSLSRQARLQTAAIDKGSIMHPQMHSAAGLSHSPSYKILPHPCQRGLDWCQGPSLLLAVSIILVGLASHITHPLPTLKVFDTHSLVRYSRCGRFGSLDSCRYARRWADMLCGTILNKG